MIQLALGLLLFLSGGQSINLFSPKQDIQIGAESVKEADQSLPLISDTTLPHRYVATIGRRVVQNHTLSPLNYRFRIVNSKEINSVGFPGGAIYVNRGLLEIASNDDEIAAILAHEVSHVASRHGTAQLSRQLLVQNPIAIAAGMPVSQIWRDEITKLGFTLGMDAPFLRYTREQESEAAFLAVQLMADARYDPTAFRTLLEKVSEAETSEASRTSRFFFNHPRSKTLTPEIAEKIAELASPASQPHAGPEFRGFRSALLRLPVPPAKGVPTADAASDALPNVFTHAMDYYRVGYPDRWQVTQTGPNGAMIHPTEGVQASRNGSELTHGVMFDLFDVSIADKSLTLEQATNRLIVFVSQRNKLLRVVPGAQTPLLISDEPALRTVLIGKSDGSNEPEVAWVFTRLYYQNLFYMIFVAPEDEFPIYQSVFEQMIRSVRLR